MNKKIFLDLGTHNCEGLNHFINYELKIDSTWDIHTFEPNPLIDVDSCVKNFPNQNIIVHKKAVWIHDDFTIFKRYGGDGKSQGSLLSDTNGGKSYGDFYDDVKVECIDFYKFLLSLDYADEIYIKMDIEWSEYEVLQNMLDRGWLKNIKKIWVEWHNRDNAEYIEMAKKLTDSIELHNTEIINWI
jgi:FkbM family methyltransferase